MSLLEPITTPRGGRSRYYLRADTGQVVPSVTTVISLTPKPYLMNWVVKLAAEFAADAAEALVRLDRDLRVETIKGATKTLREEGATKGTALHDFAEQYAWLPEVPAGLVLDNAQRAVVDIFQRLRPKVIHTEVKVWNGAVGYAGTVDGIWSVSWKGRRQTWLVDWKTSKSRSTDWALQLDAYARAETIVDSLGQEWPMPQIDKRVVLWAPYDGDWKVLDIKPNPSDWTAFLAAHRLLHWHTVRGVDAVFSDLLTGNINERETTA